MRHFIFIAILLGSLAHAEEAFVPVCERSQPIIKRLEYFSKLSCDKITAEKLATVGGFMFYGVDAREFKPGDFANMPNAVQLEFYAATGLDEKWSEIFAEVPQLTHLIVSKTRLNTILQASMFTNLKNLKELRIEECEVEDIEPGAFAGLNLDSLGLNHNRITTIRRDMLRGLTVDALHLSGPQLNKIETDAFFDHQGISVSIVQAPLKETTKDTFRGVQTINLPADFAVDDVDPWKAP